MNDTPSALTIRDILKIRDFRFLWLGQIVSTFGDSLTYLAMILLVNDLTSGSTAAIAYLAIAAGLPAATIGIGAGVLVDRFERKKVMLVSDVLRGFVVIGLAAVIFSAEPPLWLFYLLIFTQAVIGTFFDPARMALIPAVVPAEGLLTANSLSQMSRILFSVIGTGTAGVIVGVTGLYWPVFALDGATFLLSSFCILSIAHRESVNPNPDTSLTAVTTELKEGLKIITDNRLLGGSLMAMAITMLGLGAVNVLMPPLLVNDLQISETWFGAIELAQSSAMILSGAFVAVIASRLRPTSIISGSLLILGVFVGLIALVSSAWHLMLILFGIGLVMTPLTASISTLMQTEVDHSALGRTGAALNSVTQVATLISMFAAGTIAAWMGERNVFVLGGAVTCAAALTAYLVFRKTNRPKEDATQFETV